MRNKRKQLKARLSVLARERAFFDSKLESLMKDHLGEFALIKGTTILGFYPDSRTAYRDGQRLFGIAPFLIVRVAKDIVPVIQAVAAA